MIISKAYDVEIFPNLFSVTFVDMSSYFKTFSDCVDAKGKPIALTEKLSVAEIKERLNKVESKIFWISDTDDSQLIELVGYINSMEARYNLITDNTGNSYQEAVRHDVFGFNSKSYDDNMIRAFLMRFNRFDSTKHLITYLYETSKKLIDLQKDKAAFYEDKGIQEIRKYRLPYQGIDVQQLYGLHAAGVNIDKDSGERIKFGKSLKQTSINLKWHELLDFTLPPINDKEAEYYRKKDHYRGMSCKELNLLITNDFDRYVLPEYIEPMLYYNKNDVFLVCEMCRQKPEEVRLRYSLSNAFNINVLSSARSNIGDKLLVKFYSEMSGLKEKDFIKLRTERKKLSFKKIIFPHIRFKTKQLQDLLEEMKNISIYRTNKDSFCKEIDFYGTKYTLATGGIHTQDTPGVFKSTDDAVFVHWDYTSYYPSIMIAYNIAPKHLNQPVFTKMVSYFKDTRVACKHTSDEDKLIIAGVSNSLSAEALKIVINAIYGKFGSETFFLYDNFAKLQVTINGQLMTMSLIEALELEGIHCISANTDGIVVKLPNNKRETFKRITDEWNKVNKMSADGEEYTLLVRRDVNNYFDIQTTGKIEYKGSLDPKQYIKDLKKGYDMPIVSKAVFAYFVDNVPVMDTLRNSKDILDFCKTQNVGKQFEVVYDYVENGLIKTFHSQRHVRFYVANKGVVIQKEHITTKAKSKLASGLPVKILNSLDDKPIEERDINYGYYYNEAYKIIDPIRLRISSNQKGNANNKTKSGKSLIKKYAKDYLTLFDDDL